MMENQMLPIQTTMQNWNKRKRFSSPMPRAKRHVTTLPIQRMPPIQATRSSFRQQIPSFQQNFTPQTYTMLPPRVLLPPPPPSVAPVLSMSPFYSKTEVDDDVIEIENKDGILPPPVAHPNNASSNEVVTRQVPVVQNNPAVPLQNLSPVGPQNEGPQLSTPAQNESLMSGIHTQTVTPQTGGQQQQPNGNQIQNRPQPGIAIVRPQSVEQAADSSNATTSPPLQHVSANTKFSATESKQPVNNSISSTSSHPFLNMASHLNKSCENTNSGTRTIMNGSSTSNNAMTESSNSSNDRRNSNSEMAVMDLTNPTKAIAASVTTGVNEHQQQQQTPNLMPVQMATNPLATNKPQQQQTPNLMPVQMATNPLATNKPQQQQTPNLMPVQMATNPLATNKPQQQQTPNLMPVQMATNPLATNKPQQQQTPNLMPVQMATNHPATNKPQQQQTPNLMPVQMATNQPATNKPQQQQTPNLMPVQMATNHPATNTSSFTPDARETG